MSNHQEMNTRFTISTQSNQELAEYTWEMTHEWHNKVTRASQHGLKDIRHHFPIEAEQRMKQSSYEGSQVDRVR